MRTLVFPALLILSLLILFQSCEENDYATLEISIIDAIVYDSVYLTVSQGTLEIFSDYLDIDVSYYVERMDLNPSQTCDITIECYIENLQVYNNEVHDVELTVGEKSHVAFYIQTYSFPPTKLTAEVISFDQIDLSWIDNSFNEIGFIIERKTGTGDFAVIDTTLSNVNYYIDTGLNDNTDYSYRVRAYNEIGDSEYSNEASAFTPPLLPFTPENLFAVFASEISLTWEDVSENEDGFIIEKSENSPDDFVLTGIVDSDVTSFTDTEVFPGSKYYYRVQAFNQYGISDYSNTAKTIALETISLFDTPGNCQDIIIIGNYAYIGDCMGGLQIIDISDPNSLSISGSLQFSGSENLGTTAVDVEDDYAYVLNQTSDSLSGFYVVDIFAKSNPELISELPLHGGISLAVAGDYAYATSYYLSTGRLHIIDISDAANPIEISSVDFGLGEPTEVEVQDNFAYIACGTLSLLIIDVSDPGEAYIAASYPGVSIAIGIELWNNLAYVAGGFFIKIVDITDPLNPYSDRWSYDDPDYARGVAINDGRLFVLDLNNNLLTTADNSIPTSPRTLGMIEAPGYALDIDFNGDYAFIAAWETGIQVIYIGEY